nr:hypothetical protein [Siccirubricoccus sp. G192]
MNISPREMQRRPRSGRAEGVFAGVRLQQRDQLRHRARRDLQVHRQQVGQLPQAADEGEVLRRIEGQAGIERRRDGMGGDAAEADGVAIRRGFGDRIRADIAAGA